MKKKLLSITFVALFIVYTVYLRVGDKIFLFLREDDHEGQVIAPASLNIPTNTPPPANIPVNPTPTPQPPSPLPIPTPTPTPTPTPIPIPTPTPVPITQKYKNGEYTGSVADAYYGNVQVKAIINGGQITDVQFLQYPNDRRTSIQINTQAMPYLTAEAIQIQDSQVDTVSGASETSRAFRESLGYALSLARN